MATDPFSVLYPLIRQHVKRCPQLGLDVAIRQAARRFCQLTKFRRESVSVDLQANTGWYQLVPFSPSEEVIGTLASQYNDPASTLPTPLAPVTPEEVSPLFGDGTYSWYYEPPSWINLVNPPTVNTPAWLYVRCFLQPTATATVLDTSITQNHDRTIANGAIAFLMALNKTSWYNPALAAVFDAKFLGDEGVAKACMDAQMAYQPFNQLTTVMRF